MGVTNSLRTTAAFVIRSNSQGLTVDQGRTVRLLQHPASIPLFCNYLSSSDLSFLAWSCLSLTLSSRNLFYFLPSWGTIAISISSLHACAGPWAYHGLAIKAPQSLGTTCLATQHASYCVYSALMSLNLHSLYPVSAWDFFSSAWDTFRPPFAEDILMTSSFVWKCLFHPCFQE